MPRTRIRTFFALSVLAATAWTPLSAETAQNAPATDSAEVRINLSGKLRMLSQRIPSAACHLSRGIATDSASALLTGAVNEFDAILNGLENGDLALNINGAETRPRTLAQIENLKVAWAPLRDAAIAVSEGAATEDDLAMIFSQNLETLTQAQLLVEQLTKQYANPNATTHAALMLVDISGRQRMLTQKMSKESCMLMGGFDGMVTNDDLAGTTRIFEASLEALRFGMPQVGILPPPNPGISEGLNAVVADWSQVEPYIDAVIAGETLDDDAHGTKFQQLNVTMATMNATVGLYAQAARPNN